MESEVAAPGAFLSGPCDAYWVHHQHCQSIRGCVHAVGVLALLPAAGTVQQLLLIFPLPVDAPSALNVGDHLALDGTFLGICNGVTRQTEADMPGHTLYHVALSVPSDCTSPLLPTLGATRRVHVELLGAAAPISCTQDAEDMYVAFEGFILGTGAVIETDVLVSAPTPEEAVLLPYAASQYCVLTLPAVPKHPRTPLLLQPCTAVLVGGVTGLIESSKGDRALVWFPPTWPHSVPPELVTVGNMDVDAAPSMCLTVLFEPLHTVRARTRTLEVTHLRARHFMSTALALGDAVRTRSGADPWTGVIFVDALTGYELAHSAARAPKTHEANTGTAVHPECTALQYVMDRYQPRANGRRIEIYTTHEPCYASHGAPPMPTNTDTEAESAPPASCSDFFHANQDLIARIVVGSLLWSNTVMDMPLVHDLAQADRASGGVTNRIALLEALDDELYRDVFWQLREYRHWARGNRERPYVTALVCESVDGWVADRSLLERAAEVNALRAVLMNATCLATAIVADRSITGGQQPNVFECARAFNPPLVLRNTTFSTDPSAHCELPLRIVMTGPGSRQWSTEERTACLKQGSGDAVVVTTSTFLAKDISGPNAPDASEYKQKKWGCTPYMRVLAPLASDNTSYTPDNKLLFADLARAGIITTLIECSSVGLGRLVRQKLVDEVLIVRIPVLAQGIRPVALADALAAMTPQAINEPVVPHELGLITAARLGDTGIAFEHYMVHYSVQKDKKIAASSTVVAIASEKPEAAS